MRSFVPGILISIIAFALGSASALLWNTKSTPAPTWNYPLTIRSEPKGASPSAPVVRENGTPVSTRKSEVKFKCRNGVFSFLLDHLRKSEPENDIDGFIKAVELSNCTELFEIEKRFDLNNDGRDEFVVCGKNTSKGGYFCGATGNCQHWVIRKTTRSYEIILDARVTEEVNIQTSKANDYPDIVTRYRGGNLDHTLAYYGFKKGRYRIEKCLAETATIEGKVYFSRKKLSDCG